MADWIAQTDRFLVFNERDVLQGKGRMSHEQMTEIAHARYEAFDASRRTAEEIAAEQEGDEDLGKAGGRGAPADEAGQADVRATPPLGRGVGGGALRNEILSPDSCVSIVFLTLRTAVIPGRATWREPGNPEVIAARFRVPAAQAPE